MKARETIVRTFRYVLLIYVPTVVARLLNWRRASGKCQGETQRGWFDTIGVAPLGKPDGLASRPGSAG